MYPFVIGAADTFHWLVAVFPIADYLLKLFEILVPSITGRLMNMEMEGVLFSS
jgi:hypothetical protein